MVGLGLVILGLVYGVVLASGGTGMELRKRIPGVTANSDESREDSGSSKSIDVTEEEVPTRSKPKRKRISDKSTPKKSKEATKHVCRFCKADFTQSQALAGHMNRHRTEKDKEAMENAEKLCRPRSMGDGGTSGL